MNNEEEFAELKHEAVDKIFKKLLSDERKLEELKECMDRGYEILKAYEKFLQE